MSDQHFSLFLQKCIMQMRIVIYTKIGTKIATYSGVSQLCTVWSKKSEASAHFCFYL